MATKSKTEVKTPRTTVADLTKVVSWLSAEKNYQIEVLSWLLAEERQKRARVDNKLFARLDEAKPSSNGNGSSKPGLIPCDATPGCIGHKNQAHIEIHRNQVAKASAR